jgi:hypothetical protein
MPENGTFALPANARECLLTGEEPTTISSDEKIVRGPQQPPRLRRILRFFTARAVIAAQLSALSQFENG